MNTPLMHCSRFLDAPHRVSIDSAWLEHVPFGMFLVELSRPAVIVELGTHVGVSYCAFCQMVETLDLSCACFAVDTWQGDAHAGLYSHDVYRALRDYHDGRYGRFSTLVRTTFDDAAKTFADGCIDLLHIDGLHTYEAVRHDFVTWRPKLSARGIVMFHDIAVRDSGFGVFRLWEELRAKYPSIAFTHGFGLGAILLGDDCAPELRELFSESSSALAQRQRLFAYLGRRVALEAAAAALVRPALRRPRRSAGSLATALIRGLRPRS